MAEDDDEIDEVWSTETLKKPSVGKKTPALVVHHKHKNSYSAFDTKDKPLGFLVRCQAIHYTFFYHHLLTIALDSPGEDVCTIIMSNAVIQLYGRNLQPITAAFRLHTIDSLTEFAPEQFLPPSDNSQPYIEKIEVLLPTPPKNSGRDKGAKAEQKPEKQEA